MKTTKKLLSLLAMVAITISCSTTGPNDGPIIPEPPIPPVTTDPLDPNPTKYDNFFKRTMVIDHTGTGCGYCPRIVILLNQLEASEDHDKVVPIASHSYNSSDPMSNPFATKYAIYSGVTGYPAVNLDLRKTSDATFGEGTVASVIKKCNALEVKHPAKVGISASVSIENNEFVVKTKVKVGVAGNYNMGIIVLEDKIKAQQANFGFKGYDFNTHKHAVRGGQPISSVTGSPIQEGPIDAGQLIEKTFNVPLPKDTKLENARIVVYVSCPDTPEGKNSYINNVIVCKPGGSVPFKYKE